MNNNFKYCIFVAISLAGCQSDYYTTSDFTAVTKIDSHVHLDATDPRFEDQASADNMMLISLNVDTSDSTSISHQLDHALKSREMKPGKIFYAASFHFDTTGWGTEKWSKNIISQLNNNTSEGAVSVKLWKNIGMEVRDKAGKFIMVDNPGLKPVIDFIISKNLPVTGHIGEPRNCWLPFNEMTVRNDSNYYVHNPQYHMFLHPEYPSYEDQINARDHLLEMHPDLIFIGCHLGSLEWNVDELAKRLDKFPNMAVDMASRICHLQYQSAKNRERVRNFCIKYQDRLLYGTDLSDDETGKNRGITEQIHSIWLDDWEYFTSNDEMTSGKFNGKFEGLQLPKKVVDKIFRENAVKWYKLNIQ